MEVLSVGVKFLRSCERMKSSVQVTICLFLTNFFLMKKLCMFMVRIQRMKSCLSHLSQK